MRIHFIAIGGAAMHNLAIALHKKGYAVTGSDDEIQEPSRSRLKKYGLLPENNGWDPDRIDGGLDAVILGMHAREDNPELQKAQSVGVKIYSYPEFLYHKTKDKARIVIGGSHGKTTITSMVMHVLAHLELEFDYMVGARIEGFDVMVRLSDSAQIAIFEGDEYLSSPIDKRPKFHWYKPQIALLTGIAWDHVNVFPTFENYISQFRQFVGMMPDNAILVYYGDDSRLIEIAGENMGRLKTVRYFEHPAVIKDNKTYLDNSGELVGIEVFGGHNLQNIGGAKLICNELGIGDSDFYNAIKDFRGAACRLEVLSKTKDSIVFRDFAHSPSKLEATVEAVKSQYPERKLVACMELHTFSSLKVEFLPQYSGSMRLADRAIVYYNPETISHKRLEQISSEQVKAAFAKKNIEVFTDSGLLFDVLSKVDWSGQNLLFMSSGSFSGKDIGKFACKLHAG